MGGGSYSFDEISALVASGKIDMKTVDTAVSRVLRAKFSMGLFENPDLAVPANQSASYIHMPQNIALARQLDAESIVLLGNKDQTLPIKKSANIAVIGPMAHRFMNYSDYVVYKSQYRGVTHSTGYKLHQPTKPPTPNVANASPMTDQDSQRPLPPQNS
jgi:beta-glucosidase